MIYITNNTVWYTKHVLNIILSKNVWSIFPFVPKYNTQIKRLKIYKVVMLKIRASTEHLIKRVNDI